MSLEVFYGHTDKSLKIHANIASGWKKYKHGFGYWGSRNENISHTLAVRAKVTIFGKGRAGPGAEIDAVLRALRLERFPRHLAHEWRDETMSYKISEGLLDAHIKLVNCQDSSELSERGNPYLNWDQSVESCDALLQLNVNLVFVTSAARVPGIIRDWDSFFASAGLPSLGKRR